MRTRKAKREVEKNVGARTSSDSESGRKNPWNEGTPTSSPNLQESPHSLWSDGASGEPPGGIEGPEMWATEDDPAPESTPREDESNHSPPLESENKQRPPSDDAWKPRNRVARELLDLAVEFEESALEGGSATKQRHLRRLSLQHRWMSLELEVQARVLSGLKATWDRRAEWVSRWVDKETLEVLPTVQERWTKIHGTGPTRFPTTIAVFLANYLLADNDVYDFRPTLAELGILLFCAANEEAQSGIQAKGLDPGELETLAGNLVVLAQLRHWTLGTNPTISEDQENQFRKKLDETVALVARLRTADDEN